MNINKKKIIQFITITFSIDWIMVLIFYLFGGKWNTTGAYIVAIIAMLTPAIVAIIIQRRYKEPMKSIGLSFKINKWYFVAWLLPVALVFVVMGASLLMPGTQYTPDMSGIFERYSSILKPEDIELMKEQAAAMTVHPIFFGLIQGLIAGITVNAIAAFGEEFGWRGLLQKELMPLGFWKSTLLIGFIWGVWHGPMILMGHNYPNNPVLGVFMMIIWTMALAPIFSLLRVKSGSVIPAAIFHGTINGVANVPIIILKGNELLIGFMGVAGILVLIIIDVLIYILGKGLSRRETLEKKSFQH